MTKKEAEERLRKAGLRVTPQRVAVLLALDGSNHPTAELLIRKVRKKYSNISASSIYHILDTFIENGVINRVYIPGDVMRFDAVLEKHHHLYNRENNRIEDYFDDKLHDMVRNYLKTKPIPDFELEDIKIKLTGKFKNKKR
ncbi:MAG: transcriptional repressor [Chlorobi bacterium]|nr:transcriptional repressor [Chlorobiota bacterium]